MPIAFIYTLGFYFLSKENWTIERRYCSAMLTAGIGMGVSPIVALFLSLMVLWYVLVDQKSMKELVAYHNIVVSTVLFIVLAFLPSLLYPRSFGFTDDITTQRVKTFL